MLPDGRFVLLGRLDQQVKIRGYRVDLGEIEAVLRTLPGVSDAAAAASQGGEARIHAWLVTSDGTPIDPSGLRAQLRSRLPEWKIPSEFHQLDALPATANGKLDRQRLRALIDVAAGSARDSIGADSGTPPQTAGDPPVGPIEQAVASLFERLLRCGPVSRASDFFLLGGDSLQATVLHQHLERELSVRLPLQALVKDATVRGIADAVHREQRDSPAHGDGRPPLLVPLRPIGAHEKSTRPLFPLFFVHGRLGQAFVSPHMLEAMGADQPVYAFQIPGLDRRRMARNSIQEMARAYIEGMRGVQPDGPYFLGSACGGALVAVEMAIQLRRAGVAVGPILMVDPPVAPVGESAWWYRSLFLARAYAAGLVPRAALARRLRLTMRRRAAAGLATLKFRDSEAEQRAADAVRRFAVARLKYRNWRYDGPVLMLRSSTRLRLDGPDRRGPFSRHLVGDIEWFDVGGDHDSVRHPANDATARHLRTAVQTAQRALADLWRRSTTG
jgi:thioesterase domain-containing protein/acyl carrier protein